MKLTAYQDQIGIWTIGVGHVSPDVVEGVVWSPEKAKAALESDLARFEAAVGEVGATLNQFQWDALVSFAFNVGVAAFLESTMKKLLDEGNFIAAASQFDRWVRGGGDVLPVLVGRRAREKKLFLLGDYGF